MLHLNPKEIESEMGGLSRDLDAGNGDGDGEDRFSGGQAAPHWVENFGHPNESYHAVPDCHSI